MYISNPESIQEILVNATRALGATMPYRDARLQSELLLAHTLAISRAFVLARLNETIDAATAAAYAAIVARRARGEPLAYLTGRKEFYRLEFLVDRRVLIPRHETETLVALALDAALQIHRAAPVIVDVGTGSGAIALTLAHYLANARVIATDISREALAVAQINAQRLNLEQVEFVCGDLLEPVTEPFDILVSNLPYIPSARFDELPREIREYEPRVALDGGPDGLSEMRRLLRQVESRAGKGAVAFLEISEEQGADALDLVQRELPRASAALHRDLEGLDRVIQLAFS